MNRISPYQSKNKSLTETSIINSHYIKQLFWKEFQDKSDLITFLQVLVYAAQLPYETNFLGFTYYRIHIRDFLEYTQGSKNNYQLKKLTRFFDQLQRNLLIQYFRDGYFYYY